ncbi:hypothetical protein Nepgr_002315 [Nepenthes gracilis]|uniref:Uncharacterized protein n=1 Tax=Nepenthes gracilis TaxID=150966 RepID=A0AAD3P616_NEPGR|nr:hypothetical protein Nepgr_002315 [Nepenthes gracilis]
MVLLLLESSACSCDSSLGVAMDSRSHGNDGFGGTATPNALQHNQQSPQAWRSFQIGTQPYQQPSRHPSRSCSGPCSPSTALPVPCASSRNFHLQTSRFLPVRVRGVVSANSSITIRPAGWPPIVMSKKTLGFGIVE